MNGIGFVISKGENFALGPKMGFQSLRDSCNKSFIKAKRDLESF